FFDEGGAGDGAITVIGLRAVVQDESFGLAALSSAAAQAGLTMLGTYPERRGIGLAGAQPAGRAWVRVGGAGWEVDDGVSYDQDLVFGQAGIDLLAGETVRAGILAGYGRSEGDVDTALGEGAL